MSIAAPIIARYAGKYGRAEGRVFNKLYGTTRGRGVRHGLAAGGAIGSVISNQDTALDDGTIQSGNGFKASSSNQARGRQFGSTGKGYKVRRPVNKKYRCSCHRKHNRMRNRF